MDIQVISVMTLGAINGAMSK